MWRTTCSFAAVLAGAAVLLVLAPRDAAAQKLSDVTIAELVTPCLEGDNESRWGQVAELECEQYVLGFTDALELLGGRKLGICLPEEGRDDLVRRAFVKWAYDHWSRRHEPAGVGMLEALKSAFPCPGE